MAEQRQLAIVIPVYDDWESVDRLIGEIGTTCAPIGIKPSVFLVNDGSPQKVPEGFLSSRDLGPFDRVEIIELAFNMGHQRAIAVGLSAVADENICDDVLVMDSDGEDKPEDIAVLLEASAAYPGHIIVAERRGRSEGIVFRACYVLYKFLFHLLTGQSVSFGNFSLIPGHVLKNFVLMPDVWNNLAAAILKSRFAVHRVPTRRGSRYAGRSTMNLISLITHGLSAISVFRDKVFVRLIALSALFGVSVLAAISVIVGIRLWTDWAIPGWASYMVGFLLILLLQVALMLVIAVFLSLGDRGREPVAVDRIASRLIVARRRIV